MLMNQIYVMYVSIIFLITTYSVWARSGKVETFIKQRKPPFLANCHPPNTLRLKCSPHKYTRNKRVFYSSKTHKCSLVCEKTQTLQNTMKAAAVANTLFQSSVIQSVINTISSIILGESITPHHLTKLNQNLTIILKNVDLKAYNSLLQEVVLCQPKKTQLNPLVNPFLSIIDDKCLQNTLVANINVIHEIISQIYLNTISGSKQLVFPDAEDPIIRKLSINPVVYKTYINKMHNMIDTIASKYPIFMFTPGELVIMIKQDAPPSASFVLRINDLYKIISN